MTLTQLDSIDPTLIVYRAEATFVGVGMWDLFAAITSFGTRSVWERVFEDAVFLEGVDELTELWCLRTRGGGWGGL